MTCLGCGLAFTGKYDVKLSTTGTCSKCGTEIVLTGEPSLYNGFFELSDSYAHQFLLIAPVKCKKCGAETRIVNVPCETVTSKPKHHHHHAAPEEDDSDAPRRKVKSDKKRPDGYNSSQKKRTKASL